ncbi:MAG: class I SAM-dependent methyltransferase [Polyangiaceae bacterium]|nr:class I SAM-dependent methyltransferase [Myxococcales bacterium]MCB9588074.1 class I SAM-dependent methyltransferase [Polyangiaceae bacterium]
MNAVHPWALAELTAAARDAESLRPDAAFRDEFASLFVTAESKVRLARLGGDALVKTLGARTRWFDACLEPWLGAGSAVVSLGAGFDTRWARHEACALWVEVDLPEVLARKQAILGRRLPPDLKLCPGLATPETVTRLSTLSSAHPTCWLLEGVITHLPPCHARRLLRCLGSKLRPDDLLLFDIPSAGTVRDVSRNPLSSEAARLGWVLQTGTDHPRCLAGQMARSEPRAISEFLGEPWGSPAEVPVPGWLVSARQREFV